jgi:hypothetical protein
VTEDEAKTKWCPFVRIDGSNRSATMSDDAWVDIVGSPEPCRCIGSACMAWRPQHQIVKPGGHYTDAPAGSGYCGLAGAAQ